MFYLGVNLNLAIVNVGVKSYHVSQSEMDTDAAQSMQNEAGEGLRNSFQERAHTHRSALEDLLDQPSFKSFDAGERVDPDA